MVLVTKFYVMMVTRKAVMIPKQKGAITLPRHMHSGEIIISIKIHPLKKEIFGLTSVC